ncbi:MAG TPA: hypothetical protein VMU43_03640 [Candidatus Acidoferrum sp.]|nr:hypothetical protein [Candidatus Acidoferrum sp.]
MNTHPYWRAYMAASVVPTIFLLVVLTAFVVVRFVLQAPVPIERIIVFPMALAPNLFGIWNVLYQRLSRQRSFPIGLHGAILPFVMAPLAYTLAHGLGFVSHTPNGLLWFGLVEEPYAWIVFGICVAVCVYYLVWKYIVDFFNRTLGIA